MAGQPKTAFYVVLVLVILGLAGLAAYNANILFPRAKPHAGGLAGALEQTPEASDPRTAGTSEPYIFRPAERLPPVKGTSNYRALEDNTVRFALNVWAGWGPIILANEGFKPGKTWQAPGGEPFKVELVLIDDPVAMRNAYAAGELHIGWATLDMVPLFVDGFVKAKDSRVMPRIYQQIDWSNGGDGIVVREGIKTIADLRGKQVALTQNSPSQYFLLNTLLSGGVQPSEVNLLYTNTAPDAARVFETQKEFAGAVSWAPDIYKIAKVKGNRMLVTTQVANKLIADVWFARADFAKDHPTIIEGLVRGIFDAMEDLKDAKKKDHCAKLMAEGYAVPVEDATAMFGDMHNTNWAENYEFFVNKNNPTNFERIWRNAYVIYRHIGAIENQPVSFDQVMDFSVITKLGQEQKYASQKNEYRVDFVPKDPGTVEREGEKVVTQTVVIHFYPNSWDLFKKVPKAVDGKQVEELYDPQVNLVLEKAAQFTETFGAARIVIRGHTDSSMKGQVPPELVKELSLNRANAVKQALVEKYSCDPNRFSVDGKGWDQPAEANDPMNHAKNRRVEITAVTAEKQ